MGILWFGRKDRVLACRDAGPDCDAMFNDRTDAGIVGQAATHMVKHHKAVPSAELDQRLRKVIKRVRRWDRGGASFPVP